VARRLALHAEDSFWQARYYDFNVWSERKFVEKLRYIHRNPVKRELVSRPEDWLWSSFRHYATGETDVVGTWLISSRSGRRANANRPGFFLP
jgi:putative transposase